VPAAAGLPNCCCAHPLHLLFFLLSFSLCLLCRDELLSYDPYDEGTFCRSRFWLLMAYGISLSAIGGSVLVMLHNSGDVSCILQVGWGGGGLSMGRAVRVVLWPMRVAAVGEGSGVGGR